MIVYNQGDKTRPVSRYPTDFPFSMVWGYIGQMIGYNQDKQGQMIGYNKGRWKGITRVDDRV